MSAGYIARPKRPSEHPDFIIVKLLMWRTADYHGDQLRQTERCNLQRLIHDTFRRCGRFGIESTYSKRERLWAVEDTRTREFLSTATREEDQAYNFAYILVQRAFGDQDLTGYEGPQYCVYQGNKTLADRIPPALVAQFLRAVTYPSDYDVDSAEFPWEDPMPGSAWLEDNHKEHPDTRSYEPAS